jgi:dynein heavy chain
VASPATVSRCGMVYIAHEELGWRPAIKTWAARDLPAAVPQVRQWQGGTGLPAGACALRERDRTCLHAQRVGGGVHRCVVQAMCVCQRA